MNKFCGKCGSQLDSSGNCPQCGDKKKRKTLIITLSCALVVLIVVNTFGISFLIDKISEKKTADGGESPTSVLQTEESTDKTDPTEKKKEKETKKPTQKPTEKPTQPPTEKPVRDDTPYYAREINKYNGQVYYCSSGHTDSTVGNKIIDFSDTDLGYKKIPVNGEIETFIMYEDHIYYVCDYMVDAGRTDGLYVCGDIYRCDINGNNKELIADKVADRYFVIINGKLYYQTDGTNEYEYYSYDIDTGKVEYDSDGESYYKNFPRRLFSAKAPDYVEFEGGYYSCVVYDDMWQIDGNYVNVILQREDIETGKVDEIGYGCSQTGGAF